MLIEYCWMYDLNGIKPMYYKCHERITSRMLYKFRSSVEVELIGWDCKEICLGWTLGKMHESESIGYIWVILEVIVYFINNI